MGIASPRRPARNSSSPRAIDRGFLSRDLRDLAHLTLARCLLDGPGMRAFSFLSIALVAACGGGHQSPGPDAAAQPRCTAQPQLLVTASQIAPASLGTVGVANPFVAVDATGVYYNLLYTGANGAADPTGHIGYVPFGGTPRTLADGAHPGRLVVHDGVVFYADDDGIHRVARDGGAASLVVATQGQARWLATDGQALFYGDDAGVSTVPLAGGAAHQIATAMGFSGALVGSDPVVADFSGGTVTQISASTGATTTLATGQSGPLYPLSCGSGATCWIDAGDFSTGKGTLMQLGPDAQAPTAIADDPTLFHPHALAFDGSHYFAMTDGGNGTLARVDATTGQVDILQNQTTGMHGDGDLATDDQCVYYSSFDGISSLLKEASPL